MEDRSDRQAWYISQAAREEQAVRQEGQRTEANSKQADR
jgi:hypothetical protein